MATKRRATIPAIWLMTDERLGGAAPEDPLWRAIERLPRGAGIVLRHHGSGPEERRKLCRQLTMVARRRGLMLVASGFAGPDGMHIPAFHRGRRAGRGMTTASAHSLKELRAAARAGADLVFLSPVFATRSHPGSRTLGPARFGLIAQQSPVPVIALGGMSPAGLYRLIALGAAGFAGIDCWAAEVEGATDYLGRGRFGPKGRGGPAGRSRRGICA